MADLRRHATALLIAPCPAARLRRLFDDLEGAGSAHPLKLMRKKAKPPEEYPATYAPRARIVFAASFAAWQDDGGTPYLD